MAVIVTWSAIVNGCEVYTDSFRPDDGSHGSEAASVTRDANGSDASQTNDVLIADSDAQRFADVHEAGSDRRPVDSDGGDASGEIDDVRVEVIVDSTRDGTFEAALTDGPTKDVIATDDRKEGAPDAPADVSADVSGDPSADVSGDPSADVSGDPSADASADVTAESPPTLGFSVQYRAVGTDPSATAIQCELTIVDAGPNTVPLQELSVRYYFTNEVMEPWAIDIGFTGLNPGFTDLAPFAQKNVIRMTAPSSTADSYVEFGFGPGAPSIAAGQSAIIAWQFHSSTFSILNQANDYSFDPSKVNAANWDRVVLVRAGSVIWGLLP